MKPYDKEENKCKCIDFLPCHDINLFEICDMSVWTRYAYRRDVLPDGNEIYIISHERSEYIAKFRIQIKE